MLKDELQKGESIIDLDAITDEAVKKKDNHFEFGDNSDNKSDKEDEITLELEDGSNDEEDKSANEGDDEGNNTEDDETNDEDAGDNDEDDEEGEEETPTEETEKPKKKRESRAQKRIRELVQKAREADERALKAENDNAELVKKLEEREDSNYAAQKEIIESRINDVTEKLVRQQEEGETEKAVASQKELIKLQTQQMAIENYTANRENEKKKAKTQPKPKANNEITSEPAKEWLSDNAHWFGLNQERTQAALKISKMMEAQGYDLEDSDSFKELDTRLGKAFPDMVKKKKESNDDSDGDEKEIKTDKAKSKKPPQTTAGAPHTPAPKSNSKRVVRLSKDEMALADKNGISYQEWAKLKAAQEQSEDGYTPVFIE